MTRANILIAIAIAVISSSIWASVNQPGQEPRWPNRIQGFSFSPFRDEQSAIDHILPTEEEIDADLALLAKKTHAVRTYTQEGTLAEIPRLARKHGLNVTLGAWLTSDLERNEGELETAIRVANENPKNVIRVIIGNEALLRGDLTPEQLIAYIDRVQEATGIPVSTAEPWHIWMKYPELAEHVDYIATHMLPYWEGVEMTESIDYIVKHMNMLKQKFPDKQVIIGEVGWPSNGRTRQLAVASPANEAIFLRRFLAKAEQEKYTYYIMEAFDQPWKQGS
ncbi:MAG: beta-(1-3)-glucosyl transferase, partial [Deltaproteobacteria bacterium]|nr:beta-(1-3)-glucosyl transferase [Deltaproteobacteria bacterium]